MPYLFKLSQRVARSRTRALLVGAAAFFAACETGDLSSVNAPTHPSFATTTGAPAQVTDLAAAAMTDTSATLRFTEVDDGLGAPSNYDIRVAPAPLTWGGTAPSVTRGTCTTPVAGTAIGAMRSCTVLGLVTGTAYQFQLVSYRGTLRVNAVFGPLSNVANGTARTPVPTGTPGTVNDLTVVAKTDTTLTLRFTEVTDGSGQPASYDIRGVAGSTLSWGATAPSVTRGTCATPVTGTAIGTVRSCTVLGLTASATYSFELVAFRGTLKVNAVFGNLSDVASGATAAAASVPVASVVVTPGSATLNIAGTQQLAVVLKDAAGNTLTGRTVSWTSSNSGVATVSAAGLATAVTSGSATITATSEGKGGTAAIAIPAPVVTSPGTVSDLKVASTSDTSVTLSFTEVTDGSGQPASYDIRGVAGSTLTWGSSAPSVTRGTCTTPVIGTAIGAKHTCAVLGLTPGTTYSFELVAYRGTLKVNAVFGNLSNVVSGTTAAVPTVPAPVATVSVSPATASVVAGNTQQLATILRDAGGNSLTGRTVTWTSSSAAVATVSATGLVTAVSPGSTTITATSEGKSGSASIAVTVVPVATASVSPATASAPVGQTVQLTATLKDASGNVLSGRTISWASDNSGVATVSGTGLVAAVSPGSATITATSEGRSGTASIGATPIQSGQVTYYKTNFTDGTTGALDVYAYGGGSCAKSTDYRDAGSAYSIKCTVPAIPAGAAALQAWFGNGRLASTPKDPSLDQDLFQEVRFVLAPGAAAAIGGTTCTAANASGPGGVMQFKAHKSVYGQAGSAWNGWVMSEIAPCADGNIGLFSEPEMWTLNGTESAWPGTYPSLNEGSVYDVIYRYHRYTAQGCGTTAIWVNGTKVLDSPCWTYMGTTNGSAQGLLFWDGATYLQSGLAPLSVYMLFTQATSYPIGAATASP